MLAAAPLPCSLLAALALGLAGCNGDDASTGASASTGEATTGASESATSTATTGDGSGGATGTESDGETSGGLDNPFPVGGCGLAEYPLVDADEMGRILDWTELFEFSADEINLLLAQQGFEKLGPVSSGARLYLIRYVTQDRGEAVEATGFIAVPTDLKGSLPVGVWLHGTTGFTDMCGPTADPQGGFVPLLMAALGFVAVAPDYLGLNGWGAPSGIFHPYVVPEPTAIASLDSIRALYRFAGGEGDPDFPVEPEARTILWGASEGGFAALWTDRYAPHYAPEIDVVAVVAAVPPTDTYGLTKYASSGLSPATGALAAALVGNHDWYEAQSPLSEALTAPWDVQLPSLLDSSCSFDQLDMVGSVDEVYSKWLRDRLAVDDIDGLGVWGCMLERATLRTAAIERVRDTPVLITLGEIDDLVYSPLIRADIPVLCGQGYRIEHIECAGAGHVEGAIESLTLQRDWAYARLAGEPLENVCVVNEPIDCSML